MGNSLRCGTPSVDPDVAWKLQNKEMAENPMYKFADLARGGKLIQIYKDHGPEKVKDIARTEMKSYLYNGGEGAIISKLEYLRWCEMMRSKAMGITMEKKSDQELLDNFQEDYFNKFEPHEACWDLNKRGGVGESPFHLCYLMDTPVHFEVGKALLEVFPKLALDVYEGEEYFGESALHIAVIIGDFDAVQLLVKCGALVNQRATGRFFLPEDQKKSPKRKTNYEGYAYYGEYPLAFAACRGDQEIYDFLLEHGADPNLQDSFGNTVLHMTVIHEQPQMFKHAVCHNKLPARTDITNKQNLTPLTLAGKLGRVHIFRDMLDLGSILFWRFSNTECSAYPLAAIDSIGPKGETNWHSALMIIVNGEADEHLDMLEGGVIGQLLRDKWKTFARRRFIERLIIAAIHLALLSIAIYLRPESSKLLAYTGPRDAVRYFCEVVVCLSCVVSVILEAIEIASQGFWTFLKNCAHAPDQTVYILSCLLILACIPFRLLHLSVVEDVLLILAAPGAWFFLLFFARGFDFTGPYIVMMYLMVQNDIRRFSIIYLIVLSSFALSTGGVILTGPFVTMIYKMCTGDLARFGIIYLICLIGFTQGFFFLFRDVDSDNSDVLKFSTLPDTILNLFQMTLGEFKYEVFNYAHYSWLTKLVFAIFMILMPILLLNMLIAMMGNTYTQVISKSEKEWRKQWAKIVVVLERGYSKKQLLKFQQDYSVKLAGPPKHQLGEYCNPNVEQRALVVIKSAPKSRAKMVKEAVCNWKRLGKEVIRQQRAHKRSGSKRAFVLGKRRGTMALEDLGMPNLTSTVQQLAWERDIDLTKDKPFMSDAEQLEKLSPRSPMALRAPETVLPNGGPPATVKDGESAVKDQQQARHQQLLMQPSGTPTRKRTLMYNRVAPLLPPLPQEDSASSVADDVSDSAQEISSHADPVSESQKTKGSGADGGDAKPASDKKMSVFSTRDSVMALDLKSLSSWGEVTEQSVSEETPRALLSPKKERGVGGFKEVDAAPESPKKMGSPKARYSPSRTERDMEAAEGVEARTSIADPPSVTFTPERQRKHKKKRAKGDQQQSPKSPKKKLPQSKTDDPCNKPSDFDSLGPGSDDKTS